MVKKIPNKQDHINLERLKDANFQGDFIIMFCERFLPQLNDFKVNYEKAIRMKDKEKLSEEVHSISASLRFMEME